MAAAEPSLRSGSDSMEARIVAVCREFPAGASPQDLTSKLSISPQELQVPINKLLAHGKLELLQGGGAKGQALFRVPDSAKLTKFAGWSLEERLIYQLIEGAGNRGIWTRDLRFKCNLDQKIINKILKSMEGQKLIKPVTSVNAPKKKIYMLFELEPDRSLTGGAWYSDQDFEKEFIHVLTSLCFKFFQDRHRMAYTKSKEPLARLQQCYATVHEIHAHVEKTKISTVSLDPADIESILQTLIYDNKLQSKVDPDTGERLYKVRHAPPAFDGTLNSPCGVCPVYDYCSESGVIRPSECVYLSKWLDF